MTQTRPGRNTILRGAKANPKTDALLILIFDAEDGFHLPASWCQITMSFYELPMSAVG
jgi:hypothetical protein